MIPNTNFLIFGYNGRDGVVTDKNGLIYMRARYYSPEMRRFINADIIPGKISNAVTLNRFAYANSNPAMYVDPTGLLAGGLAIALGLAVLAVVAIALTSSEKQEESETTDENIPNPVYNEEQKKMSDLAGIPTSLVQEEQKNNYDISDDRPEYVLKSNVKKDTTDELPKTNISYSNDSIEWIDDRWKNKDGTFSLYDNQRFGNSPFHEQLFVFNPSGPSFDLRNGNIGLGSIEVDAVTGGWEGKHANLSLLDFGHAEAGAEIKNGDIKFGVLASIWSPSFSFSIGKLSIDIGAEVGAVGAGFKKVNNGFSLFGAYGFGGSLTFSWND